MQKRNEFKQISFTENGCAIMSLVMIKILQHYKNSVVGLQCSIGYLQFGKVNWANVHFFPQL